MCRFCLLTGDDSPYVWDFGSAAMHHKKFSDWLEPDHCRAGVVGMRGTIPPEFGLMRKYAKEIAGLIRDAGMADMPVGVDYAETAMFHALQEEGLRVVDGQQIMLAAREIKNWDEIQLLTQAASMVDGVYHMIYEELKPGLRENDIVALSNKMLYEMGSTTSRRSMRSPASAATRTRTTSPTAISAPAIRRSSTSCRAIRATAPATTAPSTSAARRPRRTTPT
jgi:Xaa-Pro aminopeptidase